MWIDQLRLSPKTKCANSLWLRGQILLNRNEKVYHHQQLHMLKKCSWWYHLKERVQVIKIHTSLSLKNTNHNRTCLWCDHTVHINQQDNAIVSVRNSSNSYLENTVTWARSDIGGEDSELEMLVLMVGLRVTVRTPDPRNIFWAPRRSPVMILLSLESLR